MRMKKKMSELPLSILKLVKQLGKSVRVLFRHASQPDRDSTLDQ